MLLYTAVYVLCRHLPGPQPEGHIIVDAHMGEQGIALKDISYSSGLGRQIDSQIGIKKRPAIQSDPAPVGAVQAGDEIEKGGLAAAVVAHQHQCLALFYIQSELQIEIPQPLLNIDL